MQKTPKHIAIIMDGNGRWAARRNLLKAMGHRAGAEAAEKVCRHCKKLGIPYLTLYAFSSENWDRPQAEVATLMDLLREYLKDKAPKLVQEGVRLLFIGKHDKLPTDIVSMMRTLEARSAHNQFTLIMAISYGGRDEIRAAALAMVSDHVRHGKSPTNTKLEEFDQYIQTNELGIPDPDLLIRTSGEKRISNFLLWQLAYAELYFAEKAWPDFDEQDLEQAIAEYMKRERRYGK
ncbi:MAG: di-trans,poly-cis-decaprenylcistransferase [Proteobacteria bacterium]|nr:di-trans,poly-cis-decaprenylcistransferase [Pseudomonadota bacterium]